MPALDRAVAEPFGFYLAIAAIALATYLCRAAGYVVMSRVSVTPALERALQALPGSIVIAIVLPAAMRSGPAAIAGVLAGLVAMQVSRSEIVALLAGLIVVSTVRAAGF